MGQINILALDTTSSLLKIGLSFGGVKTYLDFENKFRHIENVIPSVDSLFSEIGKDKKELDYVCVCTGPGSFTGIRIGVAAAQGIAFAGGITCFGVSSFDVYRYLCRDSEALTIPVIDARKERFYCTFLEKDTDYTMYDISAEEIVRKALEYVAAGYKKIQFAGQDTVKIQALLDNALKDKVSYDFIYKHGFSSSDLIACAEYHQQTGEMASPEPIYLRKSEAELALLENNKQEK